MDVVERIDLNRICLIACHETRRLTGKEPGLAPGIIG
jgi:hypothetical protein